MTAVVAVCENGGIGREGALLHVIGVPAAIGNNDLHSGILSVMD